MYETLQPINVYVSHIFVLIHVRNYRCERSVLFFLPCYLLKYIRWPKYIFHFHVYFAGNWKYWILI